MRIAKGPRSWHSPLGGSLGDELDVEEVVLRARETAVVRARERRVVGVGCAFSRAAGRPGGGSIYCLSFSLCVLLFSSRYAVRGVVVGISAPSQVFRCIDRSARWSRVIVL